MGGGPWEVGGSYGIWDAKKGVSREVTGPDLCLKECPLVANRGDCREVSSG